MKKFLATLCTGFLLLGLLAGCGSKSDSVTIAVPNDTTNEARALLLLQDNGYITLKDGAGITATVQDIAENPYDITFKEVEAAQLPNVLQGRRLRHHQFQLRHRRRSRTRCQRRAADGRLLLRLQQYSGCQGRQ